MKLVQQKYRQKHKLIVADGLIKRGFDFENSNSFLTNATNENYGEFMEIVAKENIFFYEWLKKQNINYWYIPNQYIEFEEMKLYTEKYTNFWDDENEEFIKSKDLLTLEEVDYLQWFNDGEYSLEQMEIKDEIIDLELIAADISYNKDLQVQHNVYKGECDELYLHCLNLCKNEFGSVEKVTVEELKERFDYDISEVKQMSEKDDRLQLRLSKDFKRDIKIQALKKGYTHVSDYIFDLIKKDMKIK